MAMNAYGHFMRAEVSDDSFSLIFIGRGEPRFIPTEYVDRDDVVDETITGKFFARLSAPGYLDATDWIGPYDSEKEARESLAELFGTDDDETDETEEGDDS